MSERERLKKEFINIPVFLTQSEMIRGKIEEEIKDSYEIDEVVLYLLKHTSHAVILDIQGVQVAVTRDPKDRAFFCVMSDLETRKPNDPTDVDGLTAMDALLAAINEDGPYAPE